MFGLPTELFFPGCFFLCVFLWPEWTIGENVGDALQLYCLL